VSTLSDLVLDLFAKDDYQALLRLSKKVDSDTKLESMCLIMRGVRDLEELCGQTHLDYKLTPGQRRSYAALGHFVGAQQVLFYCSDFPVINDPQLVRYGLKTLDKSDACIVRTHAIKAIKARQIEVSHILIDWLIALDPRRWNNQELYLIYESSVFDGKSDPWIFNKLDEMGVISPILRHAASGRIEICQAFLDDVRAMDGKQLDKVLMLFSRGDL